MRRSTITTVTKTKSDSSKEQQQQSRPKKILPTITGDSVEGCCTLPKVRAEFVSPTWSNILSEELKNCALHNEHEDEFSSNRLKTPRVLQERYEREGRMTSSQSSYYRTNSPNEKSGCPTLKINERSTSATNSLVNRYKETKNDVTNKSLQTSTKDLPKKIKTNEKFENALSECSSDNSRNDCIPLETDIKKYNPKYNPDNERITKYDSEIAAVFHQEEEEEEEEDFSDNGFDLSSGVSHEDKHIDRLSSSSIDVSNQHNDNSGYQRNKINTNNTKNSSNNVNHNNHNNNNRLDVKNNKFLHLTDIVRSMSKSPSGKPVGSDQI